MAGKTYTNADVFSVHSQIAMTEKMEAATSTADDLHPKTSKIQDIQEKWLTESQRVRRIYPWVAAGFMAMCILQVGLNIFLRLHGMGSTEADKLKADIDSMTSVKSAEIEHLKVQLNNLTTVKSAEIEDLKAELGNLTLVKSAEIEDLKAKLRNLTLTRLCQKKGTCEGWVAYRSRSYYVSAEKKPWFESRQDCTERGADLAIVNNEDEQKFLHSLRETAWIGLSDQETDTLFYWVDGTTVFTAFWGVNEPTFSPDKLCVIISRHYAHENSWFGKPCELAFHWICEKKGSKA
ncbi:hypothetical protein ACEWY4_020371 [Coilia grayii]|uniref:C-type lectin domain-containing protein n=1 Tax=Coilia grayii TaxID=363190 RepID=A0ABD1JCG9_9TELE